MNKIVIIAGDLIKMIIIKIIYKAWKNLKTKILKKNLYNRKLSTN